MTDIRTLPDAEVRLLLDMHHTLLGQVYETQRPAVRAYIAVLDGELLRRQGVNYHLSLELH